MIASALTRILTLILTTDSVKLVLLLLLLLLLLGVLLVVVRIVAAVTQGGWLLLKSWRGWHKILVAWEILTLFLLRKERGTA